MIELIHGDCLEEMKKIPDGSIDLVLTDPPYGTTACKWDTVLPLEALWLELNRVTRNDSALVFTASQPFSTTFIGSNIRQFKYAWVWEKTRFANQMLAKVQPLKIHEDVLVFAKGKAPYYPQGLVKYGKETKQGKRITDNNGGGERATSYRQEFTNYPRSILKVPSEGKTVHSTQKPVALMEYLIKTYTNKGETVLDFTMGSGTTGVACKNLNRNFIGIELDETYFNIAKQRIKG